MEEVLARKRATEERAPVEQSTSEDSTNDQTSREPTDKEDKPGTAGRGATTVSIGETEAHKEPTPD